MTNEKSAKDFEHIDYLKWNHKTDKLLIGGRSSVKNNMMLSVFDLSKNAYLTQKPLTTNIKDAQSTNVSTLGPRVFVAIIIQYSRVIEWVEGLTGGAILI